MDLANPAWFEDDPKVKFKPCPYGKGDSGERIVAILKKELRQRR